MTLVDSLEALVIEHDRIGSPLRAELRPGTPPAEVDGAIRGLGLVPPAELVDFFAWHDLGRRQDLGVTDWFWPAGGFRLVDAIDAYRRNIAIGGVSPGEIGDGLGPEQSPAATFTGFWRTDWFPVFGVDDSYAVECLDGGGSSPGAVWRVNWHPDANFQTTRVAANLTEWIDRVVDLFRAGAYRWDPDYNAVVTVDDVFERRGLGALLRP